MAPLAGTGFFLPRTSEDAKDKRRRASNKWSDDSNKGAACTGQGRCHSTGVIPCPARYSLLEATVDSQCILQPLASSPRSTYGADYDCSALTRSSFSSSFSSSSGASFTSRLPSLAPYAGPLTPCPSSGTPGAASPASLARGPVACAAPAAAAGTTCALGMLPQQQQQGVLVAPQQQGVLVAQQQQGMLIAPQPSQQPQQFLVPVSQPCYAPASSSAVVAAAAVPCALDQQGLQEMLLLQQQQAELDTAINNLMSLKQQLVAAAAPQATAAAMPAPAGLAAVAPAAPQQFVLVSVPPAPAVMTLSQCGGSAMTAPYGQQVQLQPCLAPAVGAGGPISGVGVGAPVGCVSASGPLDVAQLQQQVAELELQVEMARMLSFMST